MAQEIHKEKKKLVGGLVGRHYHSLDKKKRLTIPSEWRDALDMDVADTDSREYVYVLPNETEDCLDLVPVREMEHLLEELSGTDILENDAMATALAQTAQMLKVDTAGRIRIGDDLLGFAGIKEDITLIGGFRKAQIWATEKKPKTEGLDVAAFRAALARRKEAAQTK